MNQPHLPREKSFWIPWLLQAIVAYVVVVQLLKPLLEITLNNAKNPTDLSGLQLALIVFLKLLPFWVTQLLAVYLQPNTKQVTRWFMVLGNYFLFAGFALAASSRILNRTHLKTVLRRLCIVLLGLLFIYLLRSLNALYTIAYAPLILRF